MKLPIASKRPNHYERIAVIYEDNKADLLTSHRVASFRGMKEYLTSV